MEKEILSASDDVRQWLRYGWNRSIDEILFANWDVFLVYTQIVGGYAANLVWYRYRFILARVKGMSARVLAVMKSVRTISESCVPDRVPVSDTISCSKSEFGSQSDLPDFFILCAHDYPGLPYCE